MIIVSETEDGKQTPSVAYTCHSEEEFIGIVNELADGFTFDTVELALAYLDDMCCQYTEIVTQDDYHRGMGKAVDVCARDLGWLP